MQSVVQTNEKGPGPCGPRPISSGAEEGRTPDLVIANDALYQLSYRPERGKVRRGEGRVPRGKWQVPSAECRVGNWAHLGLGTRDLALLWVMALLLAWLPGCSKETARAPGPLRVVVTVAPLAGLVKPLLPAGTELKVLMSAGHSEHGYEFSPGDMAAIGSADLLVYVGGGLEVGVEEFIKNHPPGARRQDVCFMVVAGVEPDAHDDHGDEHHHGVDPHLWLDTRLCVKLVDALGPKVKAAAQASGASAGDIERAMTSEKADIGVLDRDYATQLAPLKGREIVTHHNAWSRLADRYGLTVAAVMRDIDESEMTPQAVAATVDAIRKQGVKAVFVEPQFDRVAAERIAAAAGVKVFELDPLGDGDWFKMMRGNLESLVKALAE